MTTATQTRVASFVRVPNLTARLRNTRVLWSFLCLVGILAVGTAYVMQMSSVTQRGYQMRALEEGIAELRLENEQLQTQIAEARSMQNVSAQMQILGFVEAEEIVYLTGAETIAAR